jgi:perosamine synthetase
MLTIFRKNFPEMNKDYSIARPMLTGNEKKYILDAIESGWISSIGSYIEEFERAFAAYHGVKHAIATHNGTIALHLALTAIGIGEQDEVIVPDLTFIATANSVKYCGATPVLTDICQNDWNISVADIRRKITPKTRAIVPVHLYGNPVILNEILSIAETNGLTVIEDCAEALGATYNQKKVGTFGRISCFSFFGNKIITTGEGGMCITDDEQLAERMRILRDHGMNRTKKYWYDHVGFNYRMTNMQAAIGCAQLEQIDDFLAKRDHIYEQYTGFLKDIPGIVLQEGHGQRTVNWMFTVRMKGFSEQQRDRVRELLKLSHIDTRPAFYPIHQMPCYADQKFPDGIFPNSTVVAREGISLPTHPGLTDEDIAYIAGNFIEAYQKIAG